MCFCSSDEEYKTIKRIENKDYQEIYSLYNEAETLEQKIFYGKRFLEKAKKEKDLKDQKSKKITGYRILSVTYTDERVLAYSDSIIALTTKEATIHYPAIAYEKKGDFYYQKRAYQRALDNYLQFYEYAEKFNQKDMISRAKYNVGIVKRRTGNIEEALQLYRENYAYSQKNQDEILAIEYLNSISALANIFNDIKNVDSARYYNKIGYKEAIRLQKESYVKHFAFNQGVTNYHDKNYTVAIDSIAKHLSYFESINDDDKLVFAYYYTGEIYRETNQEEKAIQFYKKVDSIFQKTQSIFPTIRKAYLRLDNYYEKKKDLKKQIFYKNQLIKVDSIRTTEELYLNKAIFKDYDIPKLRAENENLQNQKHEQKKTYKSAIIILFILILLLLIGFGIQYRKRKTYKHRFQEAIHASKTETTVQKRTATTQKIAVPDEIIDNILQQLETFENEAEFISNEITLNSLAKQLQTNPNYLSKVVNHYKKCSFSNYINNLRIEYAIQQLKTNPTFLKYTVKGIAAEVGFNNVQSFSKAFYNAKGIKPSYFIREFKKVHNK
ncbi:helix-turn-helix domain-containing protein [Kordia sp.]|uniref:helix-turn-helix domain-containing protein n=1 Tax=Kordia sp. TaxID=1965332 RepID=UPI003B5CD100